MDLATLSPPCGFHSKQQLLSVDGKSLITHRFRSSYIRIFMQGNLLFVFFSLFSSLITFMLYRTSRRHKGTEISLGDKEGDSINIDCYDLTGLYHKLFRVVPSPISGSHILSKTSHTIAIIRTLYRISGIFGGV